MGLFGIDFNRDGEISSCEENLSIGLPTLAFDVLRADKAQKRAAQENRITHEEFVQDCLIKLAALEERVTELRKQLSDLQEIEPEEVCTEGYDIWEDRCWEIEEQIHNAEAEISELKELPIAFS